ncbi:hypothetical protein BGX31_000871, partial [Mortierella sp. GBA43]
ELIRDVLTQRCSWNPVFGWPARVATVDKYQGQQNDYVLLSLVRTKAVGHVRDVRRLIVALSRARLGLYIFGRQKLFQNCHELEPAFQRLLKRPTKLCLRTGEMFPNTTRHIGNSTTTEGEAEGEEAEPSDGKKKTKKAAAKKGSKKAKAAATQDDSDKSKEYQIENIGQMGEYVFGMMKEQQQYAIQQQQAYMQSLQPPPPPVSEDTTTGGADTEMEDGQPTAITAGQGSMDVDN